MRKNVHAVKWIFQRCRGVWKTLLLLSAAGAADALCAVYLALKSKQLVDIAVSGQVQLLLRASAAPVLVIVLQMALSAVYMFASAQAVAAYSIRLQHGVFEGLLKGRLRGAAAWHTGELMNRITEDSSVVVCGAVGIAPEMVTLFFKLAAGLAALFYIAPYFALLCVAGGVCILAGAAVWGRRIKRHHKACREEDGRVRSFMLECLQNLPVIKSFCREGRIAARAAALQKQLYKALLRRNGVQIAGGLLAYLAFGVGYYAALGWGAAGIALGTLTLGSLTAMVQLVGQIQSPFKELSSIAPQYYSMLASAERLMELLRQPPDDAPVCNRALYEQMEGLCFSGVVFRYGQEPVLRGASGCVRKGAFVLVQGASGCGKSTLLKLLSGLYEPDAGEVFFKLRDGSRRPAADGRGLFAYVPQGNMILSGTIRENIAFFEPEPDEARVIACAETAAVWDEIRGMERGLDTQVGEGGSALSEGQAQRVAIARALYTDAPVLVLDEATSALDEAAEARVIENIRAMQKKTCIFVSHRPAAASKADVIWNMEDGLCIEMPKT